VGSGGGSRATVRAYLNVHKQFSANATAIRVFRWGELAMLASQTDEHANALIGENSSTGNFAGRTQNAFGTSSGADAVITTTAAGGKRVNSDNPGSRRPRFPTTSALFASGCCLAGATASCRP
jgi:hypothetical protein